MMPFWITALHQAAETGTPAVLVTLAEVRGSAPREAGAKMVVTAQHTHGTIGGGRLELECITEARMLLRGGGGPVMKSYPLGPALGQCCGGAVAVLFELVAPPAWRVAVFGAGHVGRAVVALLAGLACDVTWIDDRAGQFDGAPAGVRCLGCDPVAAVARLPPGSHARVMTHDHQLDLALVAALLARGDLASVGLIGSATKRARFASRLRARGLDPARLICPIGVPGAGGKLAAEIAISVVAQLLQLRVTVIAPTESAHVPAADCAADCAACAGRVRA
jgi:xanthine dehydrogenase accessory factor